MIPKSLLQFINPNIRSDPSDDFMAYIEFISAVLGWSVRAYLEDGVLIVCARNLQHNAAGNLRTFYVTRAFR